MAEEVASDRSEVGVMADNQLSASMEDYLEAILLLVRQKRVARVRDIANRIGVAMPSVTAALKSLSKSGLVNYDPYQAVTLTRPGHEYAERVSGRHIALRRFLTGVLGMDSESADANACRMEHAVDDALLERLADFAEFIRQCPRAGEDWIGAFVKRCRNHQPAGECQACLEKAQNVFRASDPKEVQAGDGSERR